MNMVISPLGKGLFDQAMSESGGMVTLPIWIDPLPPPQSTPPSGRGQANDIIEKLLMFYDGVPTPVPPATRALYAQARVAMETAGTLEGYLRSKPAGDFFLAILNTGLCRPSGDRGRNGHARGRLDSGHSGR